jgi:hypothetical protein
LAQALQPEQVEEGVGPAAGPIGHIVHFATPERVRGYALLMLAVVGIGGVGHALLDVLDSRRPSNAIGGDYLAFYTGGRFLLEGRLHEVYDPAAQRAFQEAAVAPRPLAQKPFINPPHAALLYAPFALLPYPVGLGAWWLAGLAAWLAGIRLLRSALSELQAHSLRTLFIASLCFFPTLAWLAFGQATGIVLLLYAATFALLRSGRDTAAGAVLGCLALKPQLAVALGLVLLVQGRVRAVASGGSVALGFVLLGCALSWPASVAYLDLGPRLMETLRSDAYPGYGSQSLMGFAALLFDSWWRPGADALALIISLGLLGALLRTWRRIGWHPGSRSFDLAMAGTLAWGVVLSLHLHFYDLALLLVPFAIVCHHYPGLRRGRPLDAGSLLALSIGLWVLGFAGSSLSLLQLRVSEGLGLPAVALQLTPLVVVAWGAWVLREAREAA